MPSSPESIIVKTGNQFNGYVSNVTHNQKIRNKNKLYVYLKKRKITSFSKSRSVVFSFDLKRELHSSYFFLLAAKLFHKAWSWIDTKNLLLHTIVSGLVQFTLEKHVGYERVGILNVVWKAATPVLAFILCMEMEIFSKFNL